MNPTVIEIIGSIVFFIIVLMWQTRFGCEFGWHQMRWHHHMFSEMLGPADVYVCEKGCGHRETR